MTMAVVLITKLFFLFFFTLFLPSFAQNLLSCDSDSHNIESDYVSCAKNVSENQCRTFAVLNTNAYYSSLFNLSFYLGLNRVSIAEASGFSPDTEFLPQDQPLLIPIECKCSVVGFFHADIIKTTASGDSFDEIAQSLEGLTTCRGLREKNPGLLPWKLPESSKISVPVRCGCPSSSEISAGTKLLVSYPVSSDDTFRSVAEQFNVSSDAVIQVNNRSGKEPVLGPLAILVPLSQKPLLGSLAKPSEPSLGFTNRRKKKSRMKKLIICIVTVVTAVSAIAILAAATFFILQWRRKRQSVSTAKMADAELQQLNLSIRTTSDQKKVSFEGSQSTLEPTTPRTKMMLESYTLEDLKKATNNFNSENLIEGSVYHGLLKGKNLAIKLTTPDFISKVDLTLFQDAIHNHPNILRVLGSCCLSLTDNPNDSYLVFEYAKNGSLKDWIHGGLAMKSQYISSCCCFLTWAQRLRICLDVALALQYMHHIMHPAYIHRNIKTRNIFLDEEFNAKVGNFGMSNCIQNEEPVATEFNLRNPASWSRGYLAPEYLKDGTISPGIDVFAYGVVLLEILSGKTPVICSDDKGGDFVTLSDRIKAILDSDDSDSQLRGWMDVDLGENYSFHAAITVAKLARSCIEDDTLMRPSAGEIVEKLSRVVEETPEGDENQQFLICESSYKPLVQAAASNNM